MSLSAFRLGLSLNDILAHGYSCRRREGGAFLDGGAGGGQRERRVLRRHLARGESVIKCPSPLKALKDTYEHSC